MLNKIKKVFIYLFVLLLGFNCSYAETISSNSGLNLECSGYKKRIEMLKSNIEILDKKMADERLKGESARQGVFDAAETKINELNEQVLYNQDILNLCQGKLNKSDPSKCDAFEKRIETLGLNKKILEQKVNDEKTKDNDSTQAVIDAAESKIKELDEEIIDTQKSLDACKDVQGRD